MGTLASYPRVGWPCWVVVMEDLGSGEKGNKISLVLWLRFLCPQPLSTSTLAIDYIQFLHKEKKKQEEEVSTLRKDVMALKIMKV